MRGSPFVQGDPRAASGAGSGASPSSAALQRFPVRSMSAAGGGSSGSPGAALLLALLLALPAALSGCSCAPAHPQQLLCDAALVIRAKISSEKVVPASDDPLDTHKMIRYEIKQIKMFKGFEKLKDVQYVYTPFDSSLCGVKLEANNKKQYLLTGQILSDGKVLIHLCNYIEPWDDLSLSQKKSLNQRYQMGCGCKITTCYMVPCSITAPNECLWTDWLIERRLYGHQARHYACIKRSDGTCSWYRGGPPPEKEFIDISEP
ncbi:metalloproteinase inhibitor 4 isoform X1 [Poecile atricapillus]|uniref:metalloproteinase inhibitor 4 isoform X1 n=2 Tax=Paridae TaxID=9153 RepID=UPI00273A1EE5|nr:metalloproteinase inhibitor 4 isoform X1 [Poecile atricapillus]